MIVVTHYQRLLNYIVPDFVHVLAEGRIVKSGGKELALELEENGYAGLGIDDERRRSAKYDALSRNRPARGWITSPTSSRRRSRGSRRCASAAFARFAELGFPTTHDEEWRFTNVAPIARTTFAPAHCDVEPSVTVPRRTCDEAATPRRACEAAPGAGTPPSTRTPSSR